MANAKVKAKYERLRKSVSERKCKCQRYTKNTVHSFFDVMFVGYNEEKNNWIASSY